MIRDLEEHYLEEHLDSNRLVALNSAFEAIAMGESGRKLFEFACDSLAYTNSEAEQLESKIINQHQHRSGPVTPLFVLASDENSAAESVATVVVDGEKQSD